MILAKDLEYGDVSELSQLLEEVSKLMVAYSQVILNSDSRPLHNILFVIARRPEADEAIS